MLYTSYYANIRKIKKTPKTLFVGVSLHVPSWLPKGTLDYRAKEFFPTQDMIDLDLSTDRGLKTYNAKYKKILDAIHPDKWKALEDVTKRLDVFMFCYEKDYETCHRHDIIQYAMSHYGIKGAEYAQQKEQETRQEQSPQGREEERRQSQVERRRRVIPPKSLQ